MREILTEIVLRLWGRITLKASYTSHFGYQLRIIVRMRLENRHAFNDKKV